MNTTRQSPQASGSKRDPGSVHHFLAIDLGASNGRGMLARLESDRVDLEEIHRFPNEPVQILDTLTWDLPRLVHEIQAAVARAGQITRERGGTLDGIGVDTWGVDYGLLDARGELIANPVHYRDARTRDIFERVFSQVSREEIFEETGLQFMEFNTLFQLAAELERNPEKLERADTLLLMPDLFHYFLTGRRASERTIASTSQLWNPRTGEWSRKLIAALRLPGHIFPEIVAPGTVVGALREEIAKAAELDVAPPVIAGACHDTAAAVAAVPASPGGHDGAGNPSWAYLSSGTWSLMGTELLEPRVTPEVLDANFTNEGGVGTTVRFLRNLPGLWLLQESLRQWEREGQSFDYPTLTRLAEAAPELRSIVRGDMPVFFAPGDMPARIREFCRTTGQVEPSDTGTMVRAILESLALAYHECAEHIETLTGRRIERLHIVGGGSKNALLNQFTADALGVEVVTGPAEATALGNALVQALAVGAISSMDAIREVVRHSVETETFHPRGDQAVAWRDAKERFRELATR